MNKKLVLTILCPFLILGTVLFFHPLADASAAPLAAGKTLVLYDSASGAIPGAPLMHFTDFPPGAAVPVFSDDVAILDTSRSAKDTYAGWASTEATTPGSPILERTAGFQVDFILQVENESHSRNNRSGFSLIVLGEDARGIELAFWENEIWAQSDSGTGGLFRHGEGVVFPTTNDTVRYRLTVTGDNYALAANDESILTGPVRDYSDFDGFPDPYQTPNFLFLGDNTTSAQARVWLRFVSVTGTEPVMPTSTSISTRTPQPVASATPPPSLTPVPSPTPIGGGFELCATGALPFTFLLSSSLFLSYVRMRAKDLR